MYFLPKLAASHPEGFAHAEVALYEYFSELHSLCEFSSIKTLHGKSLGS